MILYDLAEIHGQFNNSVSTTFKTKKELDKLTNPANYSPNRIPSQYFSPHSFKEMKTKLSKDESQTISSFSVFHNNVVSLNRDLENLQT